MMYLYVCMDEVRPILFASGKEQEIATVLSTSLVGKISE